MFGKVALRRQAAVRLSPAGVSRAFTRALKGWSLSSEVKAFGSPREIRRHFDLAPTTKTPSSLEWGVRCAGVQINATCDAESRAGYDSIVVTIELTPTQKLNGEISGNAFAREWLAEAIAHFGLNGVVLDGLQDSTSAALDEVLKGASFRLSFNGWQPLASGVRIQGTLVARLDSGTLASSVSASPSW